MPVRNAAATLARAIESVRAQTEGDWELLAVDDRSTDRSRAILDDYARRDPRVRVLAAPQRGLVPALNLGLATARASLVARMDADDVCLPERLGRQRAGLESRPDLGLLACRVRYAGDPARGAGYARYVAWTNGLLTHEAIALARFVESPLAHPSVMFRRAVPERFGAYRAGDFPEDYELWLRWLEAGVRMEKLAEPLLVWTDRPDRLSRHDPRYAAAAFARVKATYLARWLAAHNRHHPRVVVWGAGRVTRKRAELLVGEGIEIAGYVDIDPRKIGRRIGERPVLGPKELPKPGTSFIVSYVSSLGARDAVGATLETAGYRQGGDFVLAG